MDNKPYYLALNHMSGMGPRTIMKLLTRWPKLNEMFSLSTQQLCAAGLPEKIAEMIATFDFRKVDADLRWQQAEQHAVLTWDCKTYPPLLKEIYDPPPVLYAKGDLSCLKAPCLSLIGTRKPTIMGGETAWKFAYELAQYGVTIVSGLALGIDGQAHRGCLAAAGQTIAVMGTGLNCIYPYRHRTLAQEICKNGLLLSEFSLQTTPNAGHFPRRNRIISGLSSSTLIIEAAVRSGSLITARLAMEQNRDVLAIPGSIHNPQARGCHQLLQQGAKLVTSINDVLEELGIEPQLGIPLKVNEGLASGNENLVKCIGFESTAVDQIITRSGLNIEAVVCKLAELELQGMVKAVPGGYMRCK